MHISDIPAASRTSKYSTWL